jgi:hypothetical protein
VGNAQDLWKGVKQPFESGLQALAGQSLRGTSKNAASGVRQWKYGGKLAISKWDFCAGPGLVPI